MNYANSCIDTGIPPTTFEPYWNFRTADWKAFWEELAQQLTQIPELSMLRDDAQFQDAVADLTEAIQATIEAVIPLSKPAPHSRRWWNDELSGLKKHLNKLNNESYRFKALVDHPAHDALKDILL